MVLIRKQGQSADELAQRVYAQFMARGYKLEEGTMTRGVYGNGNAAARALLGGFVKRNKFSVSIEQSAEGGFNISLDKAMSGAMGGVMGVSKLNKEFDQIHQMLTSL